MSFAPDRFQAPATACTRPNIQTATRSKAKFGWRMVWGVMAGGARKQALSWHEAVEVRLTDSPHEPAGSCPPAGQSFDFAELRTAPALLRAQVRPEGVKAVREPIHFRLRWRWEPHVQPTAEHGTAELNPRGGPAK